MQIQKKMSYSKELIRQKTTKSHIFKNCVLLSLCGFSCTNLHIPKPL